MTKEKLTLEQWQRGLHIRHIAHHRAFSFYKMTDRILGLISTVFSAVVATTVFASMAEDTDSRSLIIIAGCISVIATLLAASYSFLKLGQFAERHHQAAASFGQLRRDLELLICTNCKVDNEKVESLNQRWTELEKDVPALPQRIYNRSAKKVKKDSLVDLGEDQE